MIDDVTVHKFGGSCLRDSSDLSRISSIIEAQKGNSVIVVSALWGATDRLIRAANEPRYATKLVSDLKKQHIRFSSDIEESIFAKKFANVLQGIDKSLLKLSKNPESTVDINTLLAAGERLSALVVANELRKHGLEAHPVGSEDIGICLNGVNSASNVDIEKSIKTLDYSAFTGIPVVTGWFGEGLDGQLALLSRGGSDHSAAAIARILDAKKLILWKDVDGILSINPRWAVSTNSIPYLGYDEARELSRLDAPVIHHTTMIPLKDVGIPIEVRNLNSPINNNAPTIIGPNIIQSGEIKAIGCMRSISCITAQSGDIEDQSKKLGQVLIELDNNNITCWSIKSNPSSVDIVVSQQQSALAHKIIRKSLPVSNTTNHSCLISFIGTSDKDLVNKKIDYVTQFSTEMSYLNCTELSVQYIADTRDIKKLMKDLSQVLVNSKSV
ncbi:MAG: hypothetical protein L7T81_06990 [Candidatus Poseidoniaceae archaeon]|nr:hypothetical protein [Candidatus Poseidoniaceae archaeon]